MPHISRDLVFPSHDRRYNLPLKALGEMPLSFNYRLRIVCDLVTQCQNVHLPPLTLCFCFTPKETRVTTLNTLWTTPSVTIARNSSVHARIHLRMLTVPNSEAEILKPSIRSPTPISTCYTACNGVSAIGCCNFKLATMIFFVTVDFHFLLICIHCDFLSCFTSHCVRLDFMALKLS